MNRITNPPPAAYSLGTSRPSAGTSARRCSADRGIFLRVSFPYPRNSIRIPPKPAKRCRQPALVRRRKATVVWNVSRSKLVKGPSMSPVSRLGIGSSSFCSFSCGEYHFLRRLVHDLMHNERRQIIEAGVRAIDARGPPLATEGAAVNDSITPAADENCVRGHPTAPMQRKHRAGIARWAEDVPPSIGFAALRKKRQPDKAFTGIRLFPYTRRSANKDAGRRPKPRWQGLDSPHLPTAPN